jgi:nitrogen fixation NifU-like protein
MGAPDKTEPRFDDMYRDIILDHYRRPRGRTPVAQADVSNEGLNPVCGDEVKVALKFDGDRVKEVSVTGRGCAISTASGSMLAELLPGKSITDVERLADGMKRMMHNGGVPEGVDFGDLDALEGVKKFPVRIKCALLSWVTLADAIKAWKEGQAREAASTTEQEGKGGFAL